MENNNHGYIIGGLKNMGFILYNLYLFKRKIIPSAKKECKKSWKKKLWLQKRLKLKYFKAKCFNCKIMANCKICIKNHQCNICKLPKNHGFFHCFKKWKCDLCLYQESICQYIIKKYYVICYLKKKK